MKKRFLLVCLTLLTVGCDKSVPEDDRYKPGEVRNENGTVMSPAQKQEAAKSASPRGGFNPNNNGNKRNPRTK